MWMICDNDTVIFLKKSRPGHVITEVNQTITDTMSGSRLVRLYAQPWGNLEADLTNSRKKKKMALK